MISGGEHLHCGYRNTGMERVQKHRGPHTHTMIRTFYEPVKILGFASNIGRRGVSLSLYRHTSERNGELRGHGRLKMKWEVEDGVEEEVGGGELFYGSTLIQSKSNMGG